MFRKKKCILNKSTLKIKYLTVYLSAVGGYMNLVSLDFL